MANQISERQTLLSSFAVVLAGVLLLTVSLYAFPLSGIWGLIVLFLGTAMMIAQVTKRLTKRQVLWVRFAVFLAGILLLVAPFYFLQESTGPPPGGFGAFLGFILGILFMIFSLVWIHPLRATGSGRMPSPVTKSKELSKGNAIAGVSVLCFVVFFAAVIRPVRFEPNGWYYYDDANGCTYESQIGTGPYPNPPPQNITGMYYNLFGQPIEGMYRGDYPYHDCG